MGMTWAGLSSLLETMYQRDPLFASPSAIFVIPAATRFPIGKQIPDGEA